MNNLYVIQCDDDPYCAPFAGGITTSLEQAVNAVQYIEYPDFANHIEEFNLQNGVYVPSGKKYSLNGETVDNNVNSQIEETLRIAGVQLNEENAKPTHRFQTVGQLIQALQQYDANLPVVISEKWGRGAAQFQIEKTTLDSKWGHTCSREYCEGEPLEAVEVSCGF